MIVRWCDKCRLFYDPRETECPYCDVPEVEKECQCFECSAERDYELMARLERR